MPSAGSKAERRRRRAEKQPNKYGLTRNIPEPVKREVRKACGFGCVICGGALIHYDHFDPEFAEAREHNPNGIALLCGGHHDEKTRGWLTNDRVAAARKRPFALTQGHATRSLQISSDAQVKIYIGSVILEAPPFHELPGNPPPEFLAAVILSVRFVGSVIYVLPPEEAGAPHRLNAKFFDPAGKLACEIVNNEIRVVRTSWDVEVVGTLVTVRQGPGKIVLELETLPDVGIRIRRLDALYFGRFVRLEDDGSLNLNGFKFSNLHFSSAGAGLFQI